MNSTTTDTYINVISNNHQIMMVLTTIIITSLNTLVGNLLNNWKYSINFTFLKTIIGKVIFRKNITYQLNISATKTNPKTCIFSTEYKAVIYILLKNNIQIKKMTQAIDCYTMMDSNNHNFYIDPDDECNEYNIEKNIWVKFSKSYEDAGRDGPRIVILVISICSHKYDLIYLSNKLKQWISEYKDANEIYKDNGKKYYFNLKDNYEKFLCEKKKNGDSNSDNIENKKKMLWNMLEMTSHKTFDNTFFVDKDILLKRIGYFMEHEELYNKRGVPYSMGILMHGVPGCGKTSCIKAISNLTNRHIVEVNLKKIKTCGEFEDIFHNNYLNGLYIPHKKKIIIFEDIDCMIDVIQSREKSEEKMIKKEQRKKYDSADELTLSCILNTIDGVLESHGRIIIITTNYPEKIDSALIRPGRIDLKIKFTKCTKKMICDIVNNFYENEKLTEYKDFPEDKYTPAEILEICTLHYDDPLKAVNTLKHTIIKSN